VYLAFRFRGVIVDYGKCQTCFIINLFSIRGISKGQPHEIFRPLVFFRQTIPLGPLIRRLKRFRI
jgi:hypothetical protein